MPDQASTAVAEMCPTGRLRVAVNTSNGVLVQTDAAGGLSGIVPTLATALAARISMQLELLPYRRPGDVFAAAASGAWDVCFLAVEPVRAAEIGFTRPYVLIEGTYLVPDASPLHSATELDRAGTRIGVGTGSAYDLFLTRTLQAAELVRSDITGSTADLLLQGRVTSLAGVRQSLDRVAARLGGHRVLPDRFMVIEQAAGVPQGRPAALDLLESFIADAKAGGLLTRAIAESGQDPGIAAP